MSSSPLRSSLTVSRLFKHTPLLSIVVDSECLICDVSRSYLDRFQSAAPDLIGRHVYEYFDAEEGDSHILETATITSNIEAAIKTGNVSSVSNIVARRDKSLWKIRAIPIRDTDVDNKPLLNVILELEEQTPSRKTSRQKSQQIINTTETYRTLVETVKDYAIFMLDPKGRVATWNLGAELMKGYKREEIVGRHFSSFYSLEDRVARKPQRELTCALRDGRLEDEGWRYRKDGSKFWANVMITPVYRDNHLIGFSKVTRDLTERKANEARIIAAYEESARLKSEFLANMSHEIRTPMHGMLAALNLLKDTKLTPEQAEYANIVDDSGNVLLQVINNILDYSKLTSGGLPIIWKKINVGEIITSVTKALQTTMHGGSRLKLSSTLSADLPSTAEGDPLRYRQILQNLVENAVKFTSDDGEIGISASVEREDEDTLLVRTEVTDTGLGVPPESTKALFSPFTQVDGSTTKRHKGTGLGLSICKSLAELMGGTIGYRPNPNGQGSVFWFTAKLRKLGTTDSTVQQAGAKLDTTDSTIQQARAKLSSLDINNIPAGSPLTSPAENNPTPISSPVSSSSHTEPLDQIRSLAPYRRILFAEDNALNQRVMLRTLSSFGFPSSSVDVAGNGREAVSLAVENGNAYDLILMDISMPLMDGVAATKRIRELGVQTPIVAMTANALAGQKEGYLEAGLNDYISKPVRREAFVEVLIRWLGCG